MKFPAIYPLLEFVFVADHIKEIIGFHAFSGHLITYGMANALDHECKC